MASAETTAPDVPNDVFSAKDIAIVTVVLMMKARLTLTFTIAWWMGK
jgi:hypothetical protein